MAGEAQVIHKPLVREGQELSHGCPAYLQSGLWSCQKKGQDSESYLEKKGLEIPNDDHSWAANNHDRIAGGILADNSAQSGEGLKKAESSGGHETAPNEETDG